jgi:hypothetical protein
MTTTTIEKELVELETQFWQAMKDQDVEAATRLTDTTCIVVGAQGVASLSSEAIGGMLKSPTWTLNEFEFSDIVTSVVTDDVAIVAYKVREKLTVDGKPLTFEAADASTWVRRDGRWLCALHTESVSGDPFGRDRQPARQESKR